MLILIQTCLKKELKEQAKCDEELDALKVKFDAEEAEKKIFEEILASKKAMFSEWTIAQIQKDPLTIQICFG